MNLEHHNPVVHIEYPPWVEEVIDWEKPYHSDADRMFHGGDFSPPRLATFDEEIARFHATLGQLLHDFGNDSLTAKITDQQFLQGPLADAMTHAGQLAMLRRLFGSPIASENFIFAKISADNVSPNQAEPAAPDRDWTPDRGHVPPGPSPQKQS